jgi:hypothetical protein
MENNWVADQMSLLDPPASWEIDPAAALARFQRGAGTPARRAGNHAGAWRWALWAAAILGTAVAAQQFWQYLTVAPRVAFIHVDPWPEGVPAPRIKPLAAPLPPIPAADLDQVRWRVHYDPRLPRQGVLSGRPKLSTVFPLAVGTVVHAADFQLAIQKTGISATVPPQWDGAQIALHTSHVVVAEWLDVVIVQSLPLTLTAPANFDFAEFSTLCLRILGVSPLEAQRLAQRAGTSPPWLAPLERGFLSDMEEIQLHSGPATLLVQKARWRNTRDLVMMVWSTPDRVYGMQGTISRELAISAADSIQ